MPEMTIQALADHHRELLRGDAVSATSPAGTFAAGALAVDGREVQDVTAHGEHLFYDFGDGVFLHVHLGSKGSFNERAAEEPPEANAMLCLDGSRAVVELVAPITCTVVNEAGRRGILADLSVEPPASPPG